jgi:tetratricopeptide (TPR) repeat protein
MDPKYLPAYVYIARTYSRKESDIKQGLAKPKFEKVISVASADTIKNVPELMEAYGYLGYHNMVTENYTDARKYYQKMISIDPTNRDNKTKGYIGLAQIETAIAGKEKTIESKLPPLAKAQDNYNKILAYDPGNESVKASLKYVQDYEKSVRAGINPNELKGTIKDSAGKPVANASIRVKDTAAETYSNATGAFKFEIPQASEALVITAPGYKAKEVPVVRPLKPVTVVLEK